MSKNYKAIAEQIIPLVGGKENVRNCYSGSFPSASPRFGVIPSTIKRPS